MSTGDSQRRTRFWQIVRAWTFRAAVIGAVVGAVVASTFFVMAALINPPEELSGIGAILQVAVVVGFSGVYAGVTAGAAAGFVHGSAVAWLTVTGRLDSEDLAGYHRAVRRLGALVIAVVLGSLYAVGVVAGIAGRADWLLFGLGGVLAGGMAAYQTPSIVAKYV